jgi:hypothetical protein
LRRVAEFGNVWNPLGYNPVSETYLAEYADDLVGKPLPTAGTTPARLTADLSVLKELSEPFGRQLSDLEVVVNVGRADIVRAGSSDQEVIDFLGQYVEAGATGFVVPAAGNSAKEGVAYLAHFFSEILAKL